MVGNRLRIQAEDIGDLLDRLTSNDQAQHVEFALGQAVGIGDALAQGDALRDRLKRKKEEEAAKVPVKMVPVIMIFVMPLILAPMLGPAVVTIVNALGPIMNSK